MLRQSQNIKDAKNLVAVHRTDIDNFEVEIPTKTSTIDWGSSRGQGKRSGGMIKGGMGNAPRGVKEYTGFDLSKYRDDLKGRRLHTWEVVRYYRAREYGCNDIEAMCYILVKE